MKIRKIASDEGFVLREVRLCALADSPYAFGSSLTEEKQKPVAEYISTAKAHAESEISTTFLAFESNNPIGQIGAFFISAEGEAFICAMWVAPSHRRMGVGGQLVLNAISWLSERGASKICAWVANTNMAAIRFYESMGFISTHMQQPLPSRPGIKETLFMYSDK